MDNYITTLDFIITPKNIENMENYISESIYYKNSINSRICKPLIIKFSIYISLIFFGLLFSKVYLFMNIDFHWSIHSFLYNITILSEFFLKVFIALISSSSILIYLNKKNNSHLVSLEYNKLNLFLGENKFHLNKHYIKIINNKISLCIPFSHIDSISLYNEFIFISKKKKLMCIIKCDDKNIRNKLIIHLEEALKKHIFIKEI